MSKFGNFTAPFIRDKATSVSIFSDVIVAMIPPLAWGVYLYGARAIVITLLSVLGAVLAQLIWSSLAKAKLFDLSSVITGFIVALLCPVSVPLWLAPVGSAFGVIVGKMVFGGVGRNLFNPAALGVSFLHVVFSEKMNVFVAPFERLSSLEISPVVSETIENPLTTLKSGMMDVSNIWEKLYGMIGGTIGEMSKIMLVLAFLYLFVRGTVKLEKTLAYIGGMVFFVALYCYLVAMPEPFEYAAAHLFSGSTIFVAVFLCNDYATTPSTSNGGIFFGILCAMLTTVLRVFCNIPDGAVFAVLITNVFVPFLERKTRAPYFGQFFKQREVKVNEDETK